MKKRDIYNISYDSFRSDEEYIEMLETTTEKSEIGFLIANADGKAIKVNQAQINITGQEPLYNVGRARV